MNDAKFLPKVAKPEYTVSHVAALLKAHGFSPLGSGMDAHAYGREDRVIKLVCGNLGHRAAVELFHAHPEVDGFPIIYGDIVDLKDGCFAYEIELLYPSEEPLDGCSPSELELLYPSEGPLDGCSPSELEDALEGFETRDGVAEWLIENIGEDAMRLLAEHSMTDWIDLHEDNRMMRRCGQIVALDPFHTGSCNDRRLRWTLREAHGNSFSLYA